MNRELFSSTIQNLNSVYVTHFASNEPVPSFFHEKYCYHASLQKCYTKETLSHTISNLPHHAIWEIQDLLGLRVFLFRLDGHIWLLGPFVTDKFSEKRTQSVLIKSGLSASYIPSLRLFHSSFPLIMEQDLLHNLNALIKSFVPKEPEYTFRHISTDNMGDIYSDTNAEYKTRFDYQSIKKRYEHENTFLNMIETGDTDHVLEAFDRMTMSDLNSRRYINAIYYDPRTSMAMIRALSRKAAERGGVPLMEINEITQRIAQDTLHLHNEKDYIKSMHSLIVSLTKAVKRHKISDSNLTSPILKVVSFIRSNYTQDIDLYELATISGYTNAYLSREFKSQMNMTISDYIRTLRCEKAARLLRESNLPISSISSYVGYHDNNYFVKVFKKQYSMTPTKWRKDNSKIN